jgi:hypothetical protein
MNVTRLIQTLHERERTIKVTYGCDKTTKENVTILCGGGEE